MTDIALLLLFYLFVLFPGSVKEKGENLKEQLPVALPLRARSSGAGESKKQVPKSRLGSASKQHVNIKDVRVSVKRLTGTKKFEIGRPSLQLKNIKATPQGKDTKIVKRKLVSGSQSKTKLMRPNSSNSIKKVHCPIAAQNTIRKELKTMTNVNKDIMSKLLKFGAKVAEAVAVSNERVFSLNTDDSIRENLIHTLKAEQKEDFSDAEVSKIIKLIEEEEEQRKAYRKRILESMKASHEANMAIYTQMLQVLQSVTSSA